MDAEAIKTRIRDAFSGVEFPGDWCLRASHEGEEPYLVEKAFAGKRDWRTLEPSFLDQAPDGYASALSFFSDEAFRFYLPAYLIADLDDKLGTATPVFHLTHGFEDRARTEKLNPRRYGERTWSESCRHKFAVFDRTQVAAIVAYLEFKREADDFARPRIDQALANYWRDRAAE